MPLPSIKFTVHVNTPSSPLTAFAIQPRRRLTSGVLDRWGMALSDLEGCVHAKSLTNSGFPGYDVISFAAVASSAVPLHGHMDSHSG